MVCIVGIVWNDCRHLGWREGSFWRCFAAMCANAAFAVIGVAWTSAKGATQTNLWLQLVKSIVLVVLSAKFG